MKNLQGDSIHWVIESIYRNLKSIYRIIFNSHLQDDVLNHIRVIYRVSSLTRSKTTISQEATWIVGLLSVAVFSLVSRLREEGLVVAILGLEPGVRSREFRSYWIY